MQCLSVDHCCVQSGYYIEFYSEEDLSTDLSTHLLAAKIDGTRMMLGV